MPELPQPRESVIFIKGDFTRRGDPVTPGTPAILPPLAPTPGRAPNRLDLARWLFEPANPLTARVMVNRVWQQYFGRGLVETENDFGTQGLAPTHPELLDWLAAEFVAQKWSLKALHRLIVTSGTYRQSSDARPDLAIVDPLNKLLARQSRLRLDAEIVRDVALSASGLLAPQLGGPPVFPPQPDGVMTLGQVKRDWTAEHRRRPLPPRALHAFLARHAAPRARRLRRPRRLQRLHAPPPLQHAAAGADAAERPAVLRVRQAPSPRASSARAAPTTASRIDYAFRLCVSRPPDARRVAPRFERTARADPAAPRPPVRPGPPSPACC